MNNNNNFNTISYFILSLCAVLWLCFSIYEFNSKTLNYVNTKAHIVEFSRAKTIFNFPPRPFSAWFKVKCEYIVNNQKYYNTSIFYFYYLPYHGQEVDIRYDSNNPSISFINHIKTYYFLLGITFIFIVVYFCFFIKQK